MAKPNKKWLYGIIFLLVIGIILFLSLKASSHKSQEVNGNECWFYKGCNGYVRLALDAGGGETVKWNYNKNSGLDKEECFIKSEYQKDLYSDFNYAISIPRELWGKYEKVNRC